MTSENVRDVRLENGRGHLVGYLKIPDKVYTDGERIIVQWTTRVQYTKNTSGAYLHTLSLTVTKCYPFGDVIRTSWKQRERLKRGGLLRSIDMVHPV